MLRKQYHFQTSDNGYYAWDVVRLVELSKTFHVKTVPLVSIEEINQNYWFSGKNDVPTCRAIVDHLKIILEVDLKYPIILSSQGRVMDGMHRVAKALLNGHNDIMAVQFRVDPSPDYVDVFPDELPY